MHEVLVNRLTWDVTQQQNKQTIRAVIQEILVRIANREEAVLSGSALFV